MTDQPVRFNVFHDVFPDVFEKHAFAGVFLFIRPDQVPFLIQGERGLAILIHDGIGGEFAFFGINEIRTHSEGHGDQRVVILMIVAGVFPLGFLPCAASPADQDAVAFLFPDDLDGSAVTLPDAGIVVRIRSRLYGRFFCQLRYTGRGRLEWLGEKLGYVYNEASIRSFIERMRPSLRGKDYKVDFAKQRVI